VSIVAKAQRNPKTPALQEQHIAAVLESRYGKGSMYVPRNQTARVLDKASEMGLIDDNGLLTRKGRALMARYL
jgi:hypothetical protein